MATIIFAKHAHVENIVFEQSEKKTFFSSFRFRAAHTGQRGEGGEASKQIKTEKICFFPPQRDADAEN